MIIDTHALVWFAQGNQRLGSEARAVIERQAAGAGILIPAICAWEAAQMERRDQASFPGGSLAWFRELLSVPGFALAALDPEIAVESVMMQWEHRDPADRMIVATARQRRRALMTADRTILSFAADGGCEVIDARR